MLTGLIPFLRPLLVFVFLIFDIALKLGDPGLEADDLELEIINVR